MGVSFLRAVLFEHEMPRNPEDPKPVGKITVRLLGS